VKTVTVAIPVLDGGPLLGEVLAAVRAQRVDRPVELLVIDSGSSDGSQDLARRHGARVVDIPRGEFSHGGTRNRLMELSEGEHVAFLTQDSVPAGAGWLAALLGGFALAGDVALVCGPYLPRPGDSPMVRRELLEFFARFGGTRVDRGDGGPGPATFFSSANGAVARWAWERMPFRPIAYAEDQQLARDMLAAGLARAHAP
jgi:rhamnosyltransferase